MTKYYNKGDEDMFNIKMKVTAFFLSFIVLLFGNIIIITDIINDRSSDKNKKTEGDKSSLQAAVYAQESSDEDSDIYSFAEEPPEAPESSQETSSEPTNPNDTDVIDPDESIPEDNFIVDEDESYPAGFYVIGEDMPSGIYKLNAYEGQAAFYRISGSIKEEYYSITDNDVFNTFSYILVEEGEYLNLVDASAIPLEKASGSSVLQLRNSNGKYLVGKDIPSGNYIVTPDEKSGYVEIAGSPVKSMSDILFSRIIHNSIPITLVDGQYIKLSSSRIEPVK